MARKKERLISSFTLEGVPDLRLKGFLSNTIINIKFIDYEQKVFYYFDNGPAVGESVV